VKQVAFNVWHIKTADSRIPLVIERIKILTSHDVSADVDRYSTWSLIVVQNIKVPF